MSYGFVTAGLEAALAKACRRLHAKPLRAFASVGFQSKSCGCEVETPDGLGWLKVSGVPVGSVNVRREREEASRQFTGFLQPQLIGGIDWTDGDVKWCGRVTALGTFLAVQIDLIRSKSGLSSIPAGLVRCGLH